MNRAERRAQKCAPKKYTEAELNRLVREGTLKAAKHNVRTTIATVGLVLHRVCGLNKEQIEAVLDEMDRLAFESFSFEEIRRALLEETGVDLSYLEEKAEGL